MTLTQRLTRAGLAFILLGSVAAVLPQQSGAVRADTCVTPTASYRLTGNADCSGDTSTATISSNPLVTKTLYTCFLSGSAADYAPVSSNFSITSGTATLTPSSGMQTTVSSNATGAGNDIVTSTYVYGGTTYTANYSIIAEN